MLNGSPTKDKYLPWPARKARQSLEDGNRWTYTTYGFRAPAASPPRLLMLHVATNTATNFDKTMQRQLDDVESVTCVRTALSTSYSPDQANSGQAAKPTTKAFAAGSRPLPAEILLQNATVVHIEPDHNAFLRSES